MSANVELNRRGESTSREFRVVRPDGSIRWVRARTFPLKNKGGLFSRVAGLIEDITERKQAEDALRRAKEAEAERAQLAELGRDVGLALSHGDTQWELLQPCAEAMVSHLGAALCACLVPASPDKDVLELQVVAGLYTHLNRPATPAFPSGSSKSAGRRSTVSRC